MKAFAVRMAVAILASTSLAAGVSALPFLVHEQKEKSGELAVFKPTTKRLDERRLVDFILEQKLRMRVLRVDLKGSVFFMELSAANVSEFDMYRELLTVLQNAFAGTGRIGEVRLFVHRGGTSLLVQANRERQKKKDPNWEKAKTRSPKEYLREMFEVVDFSLDPR